MGSSSRRSTDREPVVATEVERKFEPGPGFRLPDLSEVPGVAAVTEPVVHDLDATYFDSADLRLLRNKITLRRRTGGEDAGWHLKRPRGDGERDELRVPLGRSAIAVPAVLRASVEVHLRGAALVPAARLTTSRTVRHLLDADGAVLAEIAEDHVRASLPAPHGRAVTDGDAVTDRAWQEIEVELVGGGPELLGEVSRRLVDAGALPSASVSKVSRALGDRLPPSDPPG